MKLLVIDKLLQGRSGGAECDMYDVMRERHDLMFAGDNLLPLLWANDYDALWLGPYHHRMDINWHQVFHINRKPVYISQADNEEFAQVLPVYPEGTVICCRYLPNEPIQNYADKHGYKTALLPWYIDPSKFPVNQKTCDVAFICSMNTERRIEIAERVKQICADNKWTCVVGEYFGKDYYTLLSKCRVMIVESSRGCMTLKYIEGLLSGCFLIGDCPKTPLFNDSAPEITVFGNSEGTDLETQIRIGINPYPNHHNMHETHASPEWFLKHLDKIL